MTLDEYQIKALRTVVPRDDADFDKTIWALGVVSEAGSLGEKWRKIVTYKTGYVTGGDKKALAKDAGDVLWHLAVFLERIGLSLEDVAESNLSMAKNRKEQAIAKAVESEQ